MRSFDNLLPSWYIDPRKQIDRLRECLWNNGGIGEFVTSDIPVIPEFTSLSRNEGLMVVTYPRGKDGVRGLQRKFELGWKYVVPPKGYTKQRRDGLDSSPELLRMAAGVDYTPGIYWVVFSPYANDGWAARACWDRSDVRHNLAGVEVFDALMLFPDYPLDWLKGESSPNMAGLRMQEEKNPNAKVPCLELVEDKKLLILGSVRAEMTSKNRAVPTVKHVFVA